MKFSVGDKCIVINVTSSSGFGTYIPVEVGQVITISLVVDHGYEFEYNGLPWFVYDNHVRKLTKLDKALK